MVFDKVYKYSRKHSEIFVDLYLEVIDDSYMMTFIHDIIYSAIDSYLVTQLFQVL